jgi:hypothetical protein
LKVIFGEHGIGLAITFDPRALLVRSHQIRAASAASAQGRSRGLGPTDRTPELSDGLTDSNQGCTDGAAQTRGADAHEPSCARGSVGRSPRRVQFLLAHTREQQLLGLASPGRIEHLVSSCSTNRTTSRAHRHGPPGR